MAHYAITIECRKCNRPFLGKVLFEKEGLPEKGELVSNISCPKCKIKVHVKEIFND